MITTTEARKTLADIVDRVALTKKPVALGRRKHPQVLIIPLPANYNPLVSDITNIAMMSGTFDFLSDEPDLY